MGGPARRLSGNPWGSSPKGSGCCSIASAIFLRRRVSARTSESGAFSDVGDLERMAGEANCPCESEVIEGSFRSDSYDDAIRQLLALGLDVEVLSPKPCVWQWPIWAVTSPTSTRPHRESGVLMECPPSAAISGRQLSPGLLDHHPSISCSPSLAIQNADAMRAMLIVARISHARNSYRSLIREVATTISPRTANHEAKRVDGDPVTR